MSKETSNTSLDAIYARLDEIRMTEADRQTARAALAQADALADVLVAIIHFARRLAGARPRPGAGYSPT